MIWSYNSEKKVWDLKDGESTVARIFIKEKTQQINGYIAKTLISSIYTAGQTFKKLTKSNKNWKSYTKKFKTNEERDNYVNIKKEAVLKYLENF